MASPAASAAELRDKIKAALPPGKMLDMVFENVGGEILDAALANLALRARVVLCGGISSYNDTAEDRSPGLRNYMNLTVMRGRMEGFIILDFAKRYGEGVAELAKLMAAGKLKGVVATSTLDLGIDWGDVDLVVNIGAPKGASRLIQRIGRANHRLTPWACPCHTRCAQPLRVGRFGTCGASLVCGRAACSAHMLWKSTKPAKPNSTACAAWAPP